MSIVYTAEARLSTSTLSRSKHGESVSNVYKCEETVIKFGGPHFPGEWGPLWENGDPYCLTNASVP